MKIKLIYDSRIRQNPEEEIEATVEDVKNQDDTVLRIREIERKRSEYTSTIVSGVVGTTKSLLGVGIACEDIIDSRMESCKTCTYRKKGKCSVCGCNIKHKTRIADEECPMGYWGSTKVCK